MATGASPRQSSKDDGDAAKSRSQHVVHYPLNGVELDFRRYAHHPLGQRDIMISRIMEDFMQPRRLKGEVYLQEAPKASAFGYIKARDRELGLDLQVASKMLLTSWNVDRLSALQELDFSGTSQPLAFPAPWYHCRNHPPSHFDELPVFDEIVYGLLQRHFLERHPALQTFLKYMEHSNNSRPNPSSGWKKDMIEHLKTFKPNTAMQHRLQLYSGGHPHSIYGQTDPQFFIEPCLVMLRKYSLYLYLRDYLPKWNRIMQAGDPGLFWIAVLDHALHKIHVNRGMPRRRHSLPPSGTRCSVVWRDRFILFPRRPLSEMDKRSRRRSLSRSHIRAMFRDRPPIVHGEDSVQPRGMTGAAGAAGTVRRCRNCTKNTHRTEKCWSNCGYCNSDAHKADACPVKPTNRCKCRPFPQFHTASDCSVRCSRRCGSPYPPGHFKHKNAMLCAHRCCMCGLRGHSGRKCHLRRCRCGEQQQQQHLTQDCRWKVECPAGSCDRYLCTEHCRECGRARDKEAKEYFVAMTCPRCLQNGDPVAPKAG